ncbi:Ser/Thr protein phosphatase family protein [Cupriavidus basilensis OR16]|uniref:Ser/Thr protein phosphatase family protein n=1 Tax=Cupriavidus basilensis OR16 TaxID=1127483 RepID=H1S9Y9_9BURK|nr:Ser/Thr protein phosphatase family protein [Cupriavidus basilensis OR16]
MKRAWKRRDFLGLAACAGGAVFVSALPGWAAGRDEAFYFVQLSDAHWGFQGPANPDARGTLPKAVAAVNALAEPPDFLMFTGDLTQTTDDPAERRRRMREFQSIIAALKVPVVHLMPGEHDASLDQGAAYRELFGPTHYVFDHKGVHFIVLRTGGRSAARLARRGPCAAAAVGAHRGVHAPSAVRSLSAVGLGHARRCAGHRAPDAASQCDGVLRAYPPGTSPHDRAYRAPRGAFADVPVAGAGVAGTALAGAVGSRAALSGIGLEGSAGGQGVGGFRDRREACQCLIEQIVPCRFGLAELAELAMRSWSCQ